MPVMSASWRCDMPQRVRSATIRDPRDSFSCTLSIPQAYERYSRDVLSIKSHQLHGRREVRMTAQAKPRLSKQVKKTLAKVGGICLAAGLVLGVAGTLFFSNYNPPDSIGERASVVFGRIVSQNELVSVSQDYNIVDKQEDANSFFGLFDLPFTENSFWYRYAGTLKAGVNLQTAEINTQGNTVTITLDPAYVISNTPDMEKSGVLEERDNILNPIHVEDVDAFQRWCVEQGETQAIEGGLLEEAQAEAEGRLSQLFAAALGEDVTVGFVWREAPAETAEAQG